MNKTKIDYCDATWNPISGCLHGCEYCYARRIAERFGNHLIPHEERKTAEIEIPLMREGKRQPYPFDFYPTFHRYKLDEYKNKEKPRNIFVCSMADLFGSWVPDSWIQEVFEACAKAPQHRYLFLTKNPKRYAVLKNSGNLPRQENFWYGSTIDNMNARMFNGGFRYNTFISAEPLLEKLNVGIGSFGSAKWIIVGAETGNRKNKVVPQKEWVHVITEAAALTGMPVFMKESLRALMGADFRQEYPWEQQP